jgi:hypothetical protein
MQAGDEFTGDFATGAGAEETQAAPNVDPRSRAEIGVKVGCPIVPWSQTLQRHGPRRLRHQKW